MMQKRIVWIDWAKALGILLVVMGHSNYTCQQIVPMIFMIHMPLFFFVSGYLFKFSKSWEQLNKSVIKTLLIPYLLFNFIYLVYAVVVGVIKQTQNIPFDWYSSVFKLIIGTFCGIPLDLFCGVTWFLLALVWCKYIATALVKFYIYVRLCMVIILVAFLLYIQFVDTLLPLALNGGLSGALWFVLGGVSKHYIRGVSKTLLYSFIPIGFVICYIVCNYQGNCNYLTGNLNGLLGLIGTGAGLLSFFSICKLLSRYCPALIIRVSSASIAIMCLHMLVMSPFEKITHYQNHLVVTFLGDLFIVLLITGIYPILQKKIPLLVGHRN